jgi:outer membrane protein
MKGKSSLFVSIIALVISVFLLISSQSISNQVYVDVNKLLDGYDRTAVVKATFEKNYFISMRAFTKNYK